jgi:hypothetical protein
MSTATISPAEELQQMEAELNAESINNLMEQKQSGATGRVGDERDSNGPRNGLPNESKSSEKLPTRGDVLAFLEQNADRLPGGAESFKEIQRTINNQASSNKELQERLEALETANEKPEQPSPEEVRRKQLLSRMPKHERDRLEALIDEMGLISRDEIEREKMIEESTKMTAQSIAEGIEQWGEDFGYMDGDKFVWNTNIFDGVRDLYRQLRSPEQGITPNHLYILHNFDKLMSEAEQRGAQGATGGDRVQRLMRANSMHRSSASVPKGEPSIREDGDTLEDVTAKAVKRAWNRLVRT